MSKLKSKFKEFWDNPQEQSKKAARSFVKLVYDTPIEIAIGAVLFGATTLNVSYTNYKYSPTKIHVSFSELGRTIDSLERIGQKIGPLTGFYSKNNDLAMKSFEAEDKTTSHNGMIQGYAYELEKHIDPTLRIHKTLAECAKEVVDYADAALNGPLKPMSDAARDLPAITQELSETWNYHHHDVTHERVYYTTEYYTDSKGKSRSRPKRNTETIYDYTIHTFTYDKEHGQRAAKLAQAFATKYPNLDVSEKLILATRTEAENEEIIRNSREEYRYKYPTQEEYLKMTNNWATGSNFTKNMPIIKENIADLNNRFGEWQTQVNTAKSDRYNNRTRIDSGPQEYQTVQAAITTSTNLKASIDDIVSGVEYSRANALVFTKTAEEFVNAALHYGPGDIDDLYEKTKEGAHEFYERNCAYGYSTRKGDGMKIFGWTLLATALGAGVGAGANAGLNALRRKGQKPDYID